MPLRMAAACSGAALSMMMSGQCIASDPLPEISVGPNPATLQENAECLRLDDYAVPFTPRTAQSILTKAEISYFYDWYMRKLDFNAKNWEIESKTADKLDLPFQVLRLPAPVGNSAIFLKCFSGVEGCTGSIFFPCAGGTPALGIKYCISNFKQTGFFLKLSNSKIPDRVKLQNTVLSIDKLKISNFLFPSMGMSPPLSEYNTNSYTYYNIAQISSKINNIKFVSDTVRFYKNFSMVLSETKNCLYP